MKKAGSSTMITTLAQISRHAIDQVGWRGGRPGALFGGHHVLSRAFVFEFGEQSFVTVAVVNHVVQEGSRSQRISADSVA
jgi:hypothetical protein